MLLFIHFWVETWWQDDLTDEGLSRLCDLVATDRLSMLSLRDNTIEDAGVYALAALLADCPSMDLVDLSCNGISGVGARALWRAMRARPAIRGIVLADNPVDDEVRVVVVARRGGGGGGENGGVLAGTLLIMVCRYLMTVDVVGLDSRRTI